MSEARRSIDAIQPASDERRVASEIGHAPSQPRNRSDDSNVTKLPIMAVSHTPVINDEHAPRQAEVGVKGADTSNHDSLKSNDVRIDPSSQGGVGNVVVLQPQSKDDSQVENREISLVGLPDASHQLGGAASEIPPREPSPRSKAENVVLLQPQSTDESQAERRETSLIGGASTGIFPREPSPPNKADKVVLLQPQSNDESQAESRETSLIGLPGPGHASEGAPSEVLPREPSPRVAMGQEALAPFQSEGVSEISKPASDSDTKRIIDALEVEPSNVQPKTEDAINPAEVRELDAGNVSDPFVVTIRPGEVPYLQPPPLLTAETIATFSLRNNFGDGRSLYGSDTDSAIGDMSYASSMTSMTSSIYESVAENGRTYHSYKPGKYMLPNDVKEQGRLDTQHYLLCESIGGRLFSAPIDPSRLNRVLDIATGTGIWAVEFADEFPNAEVTGTDLTPIQPNWCPPNCQFEVDDAEDDWVFPQPFSYIHGRALLSCFADPKDVIFKAVANLEPGGWLEFQDAILPFVYEGENAPAEVAPFDEKEPESMIQKWEKLTMEAGIVGGRPWTNAKFYKQWFEEAGLVDVVEQRCKVPIGTWKGLTKREKRVGSMHFSNVYHGLEGMTLRNLARLGWSTERSKELVDEVRKEMLTRKYKAVNYTVVVYGRKPEIEAA